MENKIEESDMPYYGLTWLGLRNELVYGSFAGLGIC